MSFPKLKKTDEGEVPSIDYRLMRLEATLIAAIYSLHGQEQSAAAVLENFVDGRRPEPLEWENVIGIGENATPSALAAFKNNPSGAVLQLSNRAQLLLDQLVNTYGASGRLFSYDTPNESSNMAAQITDLTESLTQLQATLTRIQSSQGVLSRRQELISGRQEVLESDQKATRVELREYLERVRHFRKEKGT